MDRCGHRMERILFELARPENIVMKSGVENVLQDIVVREMSIIVMC